MQEGREAMNKKPHNEMGARVACTLRLAEAAGLVGKNRVIIGDAWFGSVKTALALKEKALYFIGRVKVNISIL
jgi:hypothetical protein